MTANVGTPLYRAPEVGDDDPDNYSYQADIYSIGLIALEMLGGELPEAKKSKDKAEQGEKAKVEAKEKAKVSDSLPGETSDEARAFVSSIVDAKEARSRPAAKALLADKFITEPDRKQTVQLDQTILGVACMKSHIVVLHEDGRIIIMDSGAKKENKEMTSVVNSDLKKSSHSHNYTLVTAYENSFALATAGRTVRLWSIDKGGKLAQKGREITFQGKEGNKITWLGLSPWHIIALFNTGMVRARSHVSPNLKEWYMDQDFHVASPLHLDLDNKQKSRSFITAVFEGGTEIQLMSIADEPGSIEELIISPLSKLPKEVGCIAWGEKIVTTTTAAIDDAEKKRSKRKAGHVFVYLTYKEGNKVALYDLQDRKEQHMVRY